MSATSREGALDLAMRVPEYWMVRPATRDVIACWQPLPAESDFGQTRLLGSGEELAAATLPVRFAVSDLFASAPNTIL